MTATLAATMTLEAADANRSNESADAAPTEPSNIGHTIPLHMATTRVQLARELFGVALATPTIGRFQVLEKLGEGAMGEVFAAFDPELDRRVAIKVLHSSQDETPERHLRLIREAQALARVSHPNVVQVFEVGVHHHRVFVAMEYVRGESLAQRFVHASAPEPWTHVLQVFVAAGHGLAAVHAAGLVHRDFKPANTIVGADGRVRILDFGLARGTVTEGRDDGHHGASAPNRLDATLTALGSIVGTPAYMAPELFLGRRADALSDQYSYCTALYEALYGVRPHTGETLAALADAKLAGRISPPVGTKVPAWLHAALVRGLSVAPERRWPSIAALLAELGGDRRSRVRRWGAAIAGLMLLALTVVTVQQFMVQRRISADERVRAEAAERDAAAQREQAGRAAFERSVMAEAERAAEVMRLATTWGRERDALVLGIQTVARHAPDFTGAPFLAIDGLGTALPAMFPARTIPASGERILGLALSPDGRILAAADAGLRLRLWNTTDGTLLSTASSAAHADLAFSPDASTILLHTFGASGLLREDTCTIHEVSTGAMLRRITACRHARFSADGAALYGASEGDDGTPRVTAWDLLRGGEVWSAVVPAQVEGLQLAPDGTSLVAALPGVNVQVHDTADGRVQAKLRAPSPRRRPLESTAPPFTTLVFSHDGGRLAAGNRWGVQVWDVEHRRHLAVLMQPGPESPPDLLFSRDDRKLLASSLGELRVFDTESTALDTVDQTSGLTQPVMLENGTILATDHSGYLELRIEGGRLIDYAPADAAGMMPLELAVSANRDRAATGRDEILLWNLHNPRRVGHWMPPATTRRVLPVGSRVVTESREYLLQVHDRRTGAVIAGPINDSGSKGDDEASSRLHDVHVFADILWSRRGDWVRLHDLRDGRMIRRQHRKWAENNAWIAPVDSPRLAFMDADGALDVFDAATGLHRCTITGEGERMPINGDFVPYGSTRIALSRDGRHLAVPSVGGPGDDLVDMRVTIWSTDSCRPLTVITVPREGPAPRPLLTLAFAADGRLVTRLGVSTFVHDPTTGRAMFRADDPCSFDRRQPEGSSELSPDGTLLLTLCGRQSRLWSLDGGEPVVIDRATGRGDQHHNSGLALNQRRSFFADGERVLVPGTHGDAVVWDIPSASPVVRLSSRGLPIDEATVADDGESIVHHAYHDEFSTFTSSRRGVIAAACRALQATEVWDQVATDCAGVSP